MKDIPAIVQSHMAKRIALYGQEPEQPLVEELFKRYSELQSTNDQAFLDAFQKLYLFMEPLSEEATQQASQVVCDLCLETERMAFIIGLLPRCAGRNAAGRGTEIEFSGELQRNSPSFPFYEAVL